MESLTGAERGRAARSGETGCARAAERGDRAEAVAGGDAVAGGGALAEVVVVGSADAMGRVLSLVNALVDELSGLSLERLACGAELFGLLFSGDGEPLWHGRGERAATDAQRRALVARDGGCVLCAAEPAWCEAHHIVPWAKPGEGPTDIDNLALLCNACHHRLHDHKRVLVGSAATGWTTAPDPRHSGGDASRHRRQAADGRRSNGQATSRQRWSACRSGLPTMTVKVSSRTRPRGPPPGSRAAGYPGFG